MGAEVTQQSARVEDGSGNIIVQAVDSTVSIGAPATLKLYPWHRRPRQAKSDVALLDPFTQSVGFVGRASELARLEAWLRGAAPVSARCLTGRAGSGKTRLAIELCARAEALEGTWDVGFLSHSELQRFFDKENLGTWGWRRPTLIVLDYAAGAGRSLKPWLEELSRNPGDPQRPLRLLLLERFADQSAGWWTELMRTGWGDAGIPELFEPPTPEPLDPIAPDDSAALLAAVRQAVDGGPSEPVLGPAMANDAGAHAPEALDLLMAGLAAAKGFAPADGRPTGRIELAKALAGHERRRLDLIARDRALEAAALAHMAAMLTLQGGAEADAVLAVAEAEADALRSRADPFALYGALCDAYAPPDGERLPPILPDLIGEAFILAAFAGAQFSTSQQAEAIARARVRAEAATIATVMRTAQDFAEAETHPALRWVDALVTGCADPLKLKRLSDSFPLQTVVLRGRAARVTSLLVDHLRRACEHSDDPLIKRELTELLNKFSLRLQLLGLSNEALSTIEEAVTICRDLEPSRAHDELLALVLNSLSGILSDLDRRDQALSASNEAVSIYRKLATERPHAFRPSLANALNNLSLRLIDTGGREEASSAGSEAVSIYKDLVKSGSHALLPDLATSLNNLSCHLWDLGDREASLAAIVEAVSITELLAAARPDAFQPHLATSLVNLSNRLRELGRNEAALSAIEKSVALYRALAKRHPVRFKWDFASGLNHLSLCLRALQRREEAVSKIREALSILEEPALPDRFRPHLALSFNTLSVILGDLGRWEEALTAIEKAVLGYRNLSAARPEFFRPDLASVLSTFSNCLSELGRKEEALSAIKEAVAIRQDLAAVYPEVFQPRLAQSLALEATCLEATGNLNAALQRDRESVEVAAVEFFRRPKAFADLMLGISRGYLRRCEKGGVKPDQALLAPVLAVFQRMQSGGGSASAGEEDER